MEEAIFGIGKFKYILTIIFGRNRVVHGIVKIDNVTSEKTHTEVDLLITLGRNAVIITKPISEGSYGRKPFIVKAWKNVPTPEETLDEKSYIDNEGHIWSYFIPSAGEFIVYTDRNSDYTYLLELSLK